MHLAAFPCSEIIALRNACACCPCRHADAPGLLATHKNSIDTRPPIHNKYHGEILLPGRKLEHRVEWPNRVALPMEGLSMDYRMRKRIDSMFGRDRLMAGIALLGLWITLGYVY